MGISVLTGNLGALTTQINNNRLQDSTVMLSWKLQWDIAYSEVRILKWIYILPVKRLAYVFMLAVYSEI